LNIKSFRDSYRRFPVIEYENIVPNNPMVSVCVQAYQHESYIHDCIQSILSQKTNFKFEILIGEDQSSDKTRDICKDYAKKYPEVIRLFLHHRGNNIRINNMSTGRFNILYNLASANGKYIALCDGDDYWMDDYKLEKQLHISKNKNCAVVVSDYFYKNGKSFTDPNKISQLTDQNYFRVDAHQIPEEVYHFSHISTFFFERSLVNKIFSEPWTIKAWGLDTVLTPLFLKNGIVFYLNEKTAVYRIRGTGQSSMKEEGKGYIHKYKYLQYKELEAKYPSFKKNIVFEQNVALIKYFSRSLDFSIIGDFYYSFFFMLSKSNLGFLKGELKKIIKNLVNKLIKRIGH
tara:strand:- start:87 stop:1121 length:1035 start_codon:yes stop_codon:yes gene_type:complete